MSLRCRRFQAGMGLVEIMVGVLIGLIGMLVVFSVVSLAEEQRRSATSGSDAQSAAAVALFRLEREIAQAGNGIGGAFAAYSCPLQINRPGRPAGAVFTTPLVPVFIGDGAGLNGSDTITVIYGNSALSSGPQSFSLSTATSKRPDQGTVAFGVGDMMMVSNADYTCAADSPALVQVAGTTPILVNHGTAAYINPATTPPDGFLYNLGPAPTIGQWALGASATELVSGLLLIDFLNNGTPASGLLVAENVIDLQAEYGVNTAASLDDPPAIVWTNAPADWTRIVAIRVGVLVRSGVLEPNPTGAPFPAWRGSDNTLPPNHPVSSPFTLPAFFPDGTPSANYRYRVFESVMPLRNAVWGQIPS